MDLSEGCQIEVVQSLSARQVRVLTLLVPQGSTVLDALALTNWTNLPVGQAPAVGIWGRKVPLSHVLQTGDRLEIYRALQVDPKEARRQRYAAHKPKTRISGNRRYRVPVIDSQTK